MFDFLQTVYGKLGFAFKLKLSTRPEKDYLGEIAVWDKAESMLREALDRFCQQKTPWELHPGDGAFYGPKLDITITAALHREHQVRIFSALILSMLTRVGSAQRFNSTSNSQSDSACHIKPVMKMTPLKLQQRIPKHSL